MTMYPILSSSKLVFGIGFVFGVTLAIILKCCQDLQELDQFYVQTLLDTSRQKTDDIPSDLYKQWFSKLNYTRRHISNTDISHKDNEYTLESEFLYGQVPVLCAMFIKRPKNAIAADSTWLKHCNERMFYSLPSLNTTGLHFSVFKPPVKSSWHLLCESIRNIHANYKNKIKFAIFVHDDMFVIVENLRAVLAPLSDDKLDLYLGHSVSFWGVTYNVIEAGIVISMSAMEKISRHFGSSQACAAGGKYWKQEDLYLGKHLASLNITPKDPRDLIPSERLSMFNGYSLEHSMFPSFLVKLETFYKNSVFPSRCCSHRTITFNALEADKIHHYYYLLYIMKLVRNDGFELPIPAPTPMSKEQIWKAAVREYSKDINPNGTVTAEQYYKMWEIVLANETGWKGFANNETKPLMDKHANNAVLEDIINSYKKSNKKIDTYL